MDPTGDLDNDGIANNVDRSCDGTALHDDATNLTFSDLQLLGGQTCGTIVNPGGHSITVTDLPNPAGLRFTIGGTSGQDVQVQLASKASTISLAAGSVVDVTDPAATITVAVITGRATVRITVAGVPVALVVAQGASATFTETTDALGTVLNLALDSVFGDVTLNGGRVSGPSNFPTPATAPPVTGPAPASSGPSASDSQLLKGAIDARASAAQPSSSAPAAQAPPAVASDSTLAVTGAANTHATTTGLSLIALGAAAMATRQRIRRRRGVSA